MSDYIFMLESHLSTEQFRVVGEMQAVAAQAGVNLFLTGGAMRDMLGGFPVRDLDFTAEGSASKLAKQRRDAQAWSQDYRHGRPSEERGTAVPRKRHGGAGDGAARAVSKTRGTPSGDAGHDP